jgi:hypothetical protein
MSQYAPQAGKQKLQKVTNVHVQVRSLEDVQKVLTELQIARAKSKNADQIHIHVNGVEQVAPTEEVIDGMDLL